MKNVYEKVAWKKHTHSLKKEMPSQIFSNKFHLILSNFLWYFLNSNEREIIQITYFVIHEASCRYFVNSLSVLRGFNSLPERKFLWTPESLDLLRWNFLRGIITSKLHPSRISANAQMTYLRLLCSLD